MPLRRKTFRLKLPSRTLVLGERTLVMGVLNVTPDSFSDGGKFLDPQRAVEHALEMERAGADLLDIGGESTRPGSTGTAAETELARILPVLEGLHGALKIPIAVDTRKSQVAEASISAGAQIINDISGLRFDPRIAEVAHRRGVPLILMHLRGEPATMQKGLFARDVMKDVVQGLRASIRKARAAGVRKSRFSRRDAGPERQTSAARGAPLGHRCNDDGQHSWRGAYRARPRRGGNGASRAGCRLPAGFRQLPQFSLAKAPALKLQSLASGSFGKKDVHPSNYLVCRCRVNPPLRRTVPLPFQPHYF